MKGQFIISLDFELLWGVRDLYDRESYRDNILGARDAIPRILDIFSDFGISATWATVGFLFCASRDELIAMSPPEELRPCYVNRRLSNYSYFSEVGPDERRDPFYFASSLIKKIASCPRQEIATHTFSHFYTLEPGATLQALDADLQAAQMVAENYGFSMKSIVFPRNQYSPLHVELCQALGVTVWRGAPEPWAYQPQPGRAQSVIRRGVRLLDAYGGILGPLSFKPNARVNGNVPASRFLRPCVGATGRFHNLHISTIKRGMSHAARYGRGYHLWWHPHNFGQATEENLSGLREILHHFSILSNEYGMESRSMQEAA